MRIPGPTTDFPTWRSGKGTEYHQKIWLYRSLGFDYRTSTGLGKQTLGGHKQNLLGTGTHKKGVVTPQETDPDLPVSVQESLVVVWVYSGLTQVRGIEYNSAGISPFEGGYCYYPYHSLALGQTTEREHSPAHQHKIGLKIYWAWPHPSEQADFPIASPSHQEASTSLLSLSIRGQTEWKP